MDYKILINKNAVPVLIEASDSSDPDKWFSLDDESRHIQFKDKESEVSARDLCYESQCPTPTNCTNLSCDCKLRIGQTFPLPTGYKVSFEEEQYMGSESETSFTIGYRKVAILSKLEEEKCPTCGNTYKSSDPIFCSNSFHLVAPSEEVKQFDGSVQFELDFGIRRIRVNCPDEDDDIYIQVKSDKQYAGLSLSLDEAEQLANYIIGHVKNARISNP